MTKMIMKTAYIVSIPCKTLLLSTELRKLLVLRYWIYPNIISIEKSHTSTQVYKESWFCWGYHCKPGENVEAHGGRKKKYYVYAKADCK